MSVTMVTRLGHAYRKNVQRPESRPYSFAIQATERRYLGAGDLGDPAKDKPLVSSPPTAITRRGYEADKERVTPSEIRPRDRTHDALIVDGLKALDTGDDYDVSRNVLTGRNPVLGLSVTRYTSWTSGPRLAACQSLAEAAGDRK